MYGLEHSYLRGALEGIWWLILVSFFAFLIVKAVTVIYNLFFHPLRRFPGPWLAAATPLPFVLRLWTGRMVQWTTALHLKYGEVVRVQPDELSLVTASAWHDIYQNRPQLPKPELGSFKSVNGVRPIAGLTNTDDHTRQRRILSPAFSDRALKGQEYILQSYTDLLIKRLAEVSKNGKEVDICKWYMFTTFDVISDLCFGESFNGLTSGEYHPWIDMIFKSVKVGQIIASFSFLPPLGGIFESLMPSSVKKKVEEHFAYSVHQIDKRIEQKSDRPDIMKFILENNHTQGMTRAEIDSTVQLLILAGSETSATTMTSSTWFSLTNEQVWDKLKKEIRNAFSKYDDINVASTSRLPYLHAVIQEAMRLHPLGPVSVPRLVDRPDVVISGRPVPMGTRVGIPQKTAYKLPTNFVDSLSFIPERWLPDSDPKYNADDKDVFRPFMVGPRNCIGQALAWAEMKLTLCKVIWTFDIELTANNKADWADQKVFMLHEIGALNVRLTPTGLP